MSAPTKILLIEPVYEALVAIAEAGDPCPTSAELAKSFGINKASASYIVRCLVDVGRIECETVGNRRRIFIPATGKRTDVSRPAFGAANYGQRDVLPAPVHATAVDYSPHNLRFKSQVSA